MLMRSLNYDITNYDPNCCIMCIVFLTDGALFSKRIISILGTTMIMMTTCVPSCLENIPYYLCLFCFPCYTVFYHNVLSRQDVKEDVLL